MILSLDEVRQTRFHIARRAGYEVTDVDNFVDKVELTVKTLTEENETLKKQVSSVGATASPAAAAMSEAENERLRKEIEQLRADAGKGDGASESLRRENEDLRRRVEQLQSELATARQEATRLAAQPAAAADSKTERIVVETSAQASPAVVRLVQMATEQAENLVNEAEAEATRKVEEANRKAHEITVDARTKAERVESEARVNAERMTGEAQRKADNLNNEVAARRSELFSQLESERDELHSRVGSLRGFEATFRQNLTEHLKAQISTLEGASFEPDHKPSLLSEKAADATEAPAQSATPRLDALLGEHH